MRSTLVVLAFALRVCGESPRSPAVQAPPTTEQVPGAGPVVAAGGALTAQVSAEADGQLVADVRDARGEPVRAHSVIVAVRRPDEDPLPVAMTYDEGNHRYVGRVSGIPAGSYPIEVTVRPTAEAPPVEIVSAPVAVRATAVVPAPRHGGRVQVVGEYAVETVAARGGDVNLYFTDRSGQPVPPAEVRVPAVQVVVEGRPLRASPQLEGGVWVAHTGAPLTAQVAVEVPEVEIRGRHHEGVVVAAIPVVAVVPTAVVARPAVVVAAPPAVVVQAPQIVLPSVVVATPGVVVVDGDDDDHHDHGRHRGHYRGHHRGHRGRGIFGIFR